MTMNKEQQIEEMAKKIRVSYSNSPCTTDAAEAIYNAGYRKTFTSDIASDTQKAFKEGYEKAQSELKTEIERLKAENDKLMGAIGAEEWLNKNYKSGIFTFVTSERGAGRKGIENGHKKHN